MHLAVAARTEAAGLWRDTWPWGVLIAGELFIRLIFDTYAPPAPTGYGPRSAITTYAIISTFLLIGAVVAARSGRVRRAPIVAVTAGLFGHVLGIVTTAIVYFTVVVTDPTKLATFDMTGGWDETLAFSFIAPAAGALLAFLGAVAGRGCSRVFSLAAARR